MSDDHCHCHDHDEKDEHEHSSIEEAGGCAAGVTGSIENFNTDAEEKLADALMAVGKYVQGESGCLLGHIKAAVYVEDGKGITLNLIDMDNGVEHHGTMPRADNVKFNFMCAVLDVDEHELLHEMLHAIDDSGLDYKIDPESVHHHHHHHDHDDHDDDDDDHEEHCHCHDEDDDDDLLDSEGHLNADHHHDDGHEEHCHCHHHDHDDHDDDDDDHDGHCCCHHHHHHDD